MKKLAVLVALCLLAIEPRDAWAGQSAMGTPTGVLVSTHGAAFFYSDGTRSNVPACVVAGNQSRWVINVSTDAGKAIYSALLTAIARGKRVHVNGTGNCAFWGDTESVDFIAVED